MATLVWDAPGERVYENGLDRGVLYLPSGAGVSWNGLTSVKENALYKTSPVHFDGVKFVDNVQFGDPKFTLRAFTYPEEFEALQGTLQDQSGVYLTGQPPSPFGLSYRTMVNNDLSGQSGYKIHLLYSVTAVPRDIDRETLGLDGSLIEFEWTLHGVPQEVSGFRPTVHVVLDTRKLDPFLIADIESILYGDSDNDPTLPPLKALTTFVRKWNRFIVVDNGDGTWTATTILDGVITMVNATEFSITTDTATYLDADTYTLESSEKNEEDIWLL